MSFILVLCQCRYIYIILDSTQLFVGLFWLQITVLGYLNIEFAIQKLQYLYVDFN